MGQLRLRGQEPETLSERRAACWSLRVLRPPGQLGMEACRHQDRRINRHRPARLERSGDRRPRLLLLRPEL